MSALVKVPVPAAAGNVWYVRCGAYMEHDPWDAHYHPVDTPGRLRTLGSAALMGTSQPGAGR